MQYFKSISILIIIFSSLLFLISFDTENILKANKSRKKVLNDHAIKLKSCLDLDNKNKRRIYESLRLIKYCMKEFKIE